MKYIKSVSPTIKTLISATLVFWIALMVMQVLGVGCDNTFCSRDGYKYGSRLFLGSAILAYVGRIFLTYQNRSNSSKKDFRLFTSIATGMVVMIAYVYARSFFNYFAINIPISRAEVIVFLAFIGSVHFYKTNNALQTKSQANDSKIKQHLFSLIILLSLCVVIANRELPREVMLSSDPDFHAFFGMQIAHFGSVPYHQYEWGQQSFNYPAGSGVIQFVWHLVSGLKPMDSLISLPILFTFIGSLIVVESVIFDVKTITQRIIIQISTIALAAAGFLYPLYAEYAHMEGSARQLSILFVALFMSISIEYFTDPEKYDLKQLILPTMVIFVLMAMNPANIAIPSVTLFTMIVIGFFKGQNRLILAPVLLLGILLSLLDPYYHNLIGIAKTARTDTVIYADHLVLIGLPQIAKNTVDIWLGNFGRFTNDMAVLLAEVRQPFFIIIFCFYCAISFVAGTRLKNVKFIAIGFFIFISAFYLMYGFSQALISDRRYFLLAPYIFFSLSQYKAMILICMAAVIMRRIVIDRTTFIWLIPIAALLIIPVKMLIRSEQEMLLDPRKSYCGAFDCIAAGDRVLLRKFRKLVERGDLQKEFDGKAKVLVPNLISKSEIETWIFPIGSGRVLPHYDVLPAAFYYYQGDIDYSTRSYLDHVCDRFDRAWLISKDVRYIFVPSQRAEVCLAGLDELIKSEEVILQEGDAYLLKLKAPS